MPRYIDADYLLREISFYADRPTKSAMKTIKEIARHPADVVERKKGKWIDGLCCSECGWVNEAESGFIREAKGFNFCPNCGAEMEKADETPPNVYECDPEKNTECTKESCFINGGPCHMTTYEELKKEKTND